MGRSVKFVVVLAAIAVMASSAGRFKGVDGGSGPKPLPAPIPFAH